MSKFSCPHCQKTLKSKMDLLAGKKIKCPSCHEIFRLPEDVDSRQSMTPARSAIAASAVAKRRRVDVEDEEDDNRPSLRKSRDRDDEDEAPPRRRKKKAASNRNLMLALGGVGLLVVVVAFAGFIWPGFLVSSGKVKSGVSTPIQAKGPRPPNDNQANTGGKGGLVEEAIMAPKKGPSGDAPSIRRIMARLGKGPQALTGNIGKELKSDAPAWDALPGQTTEYLELARSLAGQDPPRGSKESWSTLSAAFADAAATLDKSVQAKDKDGALAALRSLETSCMSCHQAHRGGPGGFGPKGGFRPKGGNGPKGPTPQ